MIPFLLVPLDAVEDVVQDLLQTVPLVKEVQFSAVFLIFPVEHWTPLAAPIRAIKTQEELGWSQAPEATQEIICFMKSHARFLKVKGAEERRTTPPQDSVTLQERR